MGVIPYESQIDARTGRSKGGRLVNTYTADSFGAASGRAMQEFGAKVEGVADNLIAERDRKEKQEALYGESLFDPSKAIESVKGEVNASADGYKDRVRETYTNEVETYLNGFENDRVRQELRSRLMARLPAYTAQAENYQTVSSEAASKDRTNQVLAGVQNRVLANPNAYDDAVKMGSEAIDLYGPLPGPARAAMKDQLAYDLAKTRFEGRINGAKTPAEFDDIAAELNQPEWQGKMMPKDYEDMTGKVVSAKRAYQQQMGSEAKATLKILEDRSKDPMNLIPQEELQQAQSIAAASGDTANQQRLARVVRDQQIVRSERKLTPAQLRQRIESTKQKDDSTGILPPDVSGYVNETANTYGVNASYLTATVKREFGGELAKPNPDYALKNPEPGATSTGIMQFTEGTFKRLVKDPSVAAALGVKEGMTDAEILAMRGDPKKAIIAGAILAKQNKSQLETSLGRSVSDAELYMAHFMGAPQAVKFLQAVESNGDTAAAALFPAEAKMNKNVFEDKNGRLYTMTEAYQNIANSLTATTSRVSYDDNQVRDKMLATMEQSLNGPEGLKYAASVGVVSLTPLDQEGGFAARGKALETANNYYGRQLKPFTTDEEAYVTRVIEEGNVNDVTGMMSGIQAMGAPGARAAFAQLKLKNPAFAHAGALALDGDPATAADIVRGYKRMKENPSILVGMGATDEKVQERFESTVGASLSRIAPADRQAVQEAATAYMVETQSSSGKSFSAARYDEAINKVLNGRIAKVNGERTYLPAGIDALDMRRALAKMTIQDYVGLSISGAIPLHADGAAIDPRDMDDELIFRALGDDKYAVADGSGAFLWTGKTAKDGSPEKFIMELKPERLRSILDRRQ